MRVTVLGTGNAAITAAYHQARNGVDVCLFGMPGYEKPLQDIHEAGGIEALAHHEGNALILPGKASPHTLTTDIQTAVSFADLMIMPVPSFAQVPVFRQILPFLKSGQTICLMPGNYGSLALRHIQQQAGYGHLMLDFVDCISIPWATRLVGPAQLAIYGMKQQLPAATLPANRSEPILARLSSLFGLPFTPLANVIEAGLENINFGGHPLMTICNIGLLENFAGDFNFYRDCCSPSIARVADKLDQERLSVGRAFGLTLKTELAAMNALYGTDFSSVYELNRGSETHGKINSAPASADSRYITEDVPYLLVPCLALARLAGVETPVLEACVQLASTLNGTDYLAQGRTLDSLGLAGLKAVEVLERC
ncbi:NAD/NADP-dependent octopine/nopaline dehydrogenase family protein [Leeia oryzae]|uniref:NAD/NADP-dependent octopine/nopaline dehydrogenase family protein n=1 Tax=Leeia oryzae TaxID=356662 RepID=UPI0003722124|nr:NAD/NADP-dependent octopine/nopaline dehydrogenase family protein [Leeia oryzae]